MRGMPRRYEFGAGEPIVFQTRRTVGKAALSPDGARLLTVSTGSIEIYDVARPQDPPIILEPHRRIPTSAAFSPDGQRIATGNIDGGVELWPLTVDGLHQALRATTSACLDPELRMKSLGEPREKAWRTYAECERRHGRTVPDVE